MSTLQSVIEELSDEAEEKEQRKFQFTEFGKGYMKALEDLQIKLGQDAHKESPWENIGSTLPGETSCGDTHRLKVHGGWLVRVTEYSYASDDKFSYRVHSTVTFVTDPEHKWSLDGHDQGQSGNGSGSSVPGDQVGTPQAGSTVQPNPPNS